MQQTFPASREPRVIIENISGDLSVRSWDQPSIGIETDGPGFKKITIKPEPGGDMKFATTKYNSIRGEIESSWKTADGKTTYNVTIPPNTTATIHIPAASERSVKESKNDGVKFVEMKDGCAVYSVGSGKYEFTATK